ncbi:MAG: chromosomal replication initiator protein DnaA, partial [Azonexus sp.]|nr:chromosomal replication initiator protein DnaA [Azonexus sp.]
MAGFWESCLKRFEQELPAQQFNTWIKPLRLEGEEAVREEGLRLIAPNTFVAKWIRDRYLARIESYGQEFFHTNISIALVVQSAKPAVSRSSHAPQVALESDSPAKPAIAPQSTAGNSRGRTGLPDKSRLIPEFTFDNLVVGKANDLARAAAIQVGNNPGGSYNPLFIYGGAGLGKTHLIHAIGNLIRTEHPGKVVRYAHAEDYYSDVVRAYQQKAFDTFKQNYRSIDVLLLDDVQFFNGKARSQEEFFFLFNSLIETRKQLIITCDTYPKDINGLDDRLVTRFDWGLTVQIEPPELEMRVAILKKKAEAEGIQLDDEVAFFIAKHLRSNVRELEGALKRVLAYSSFHGRAISLELAKDALKDVIGSVRNIGIDNIQKTVADYYKIKVADLFSKKRTRA